MRIDLRARILCALLCGIMAAVAQGASAALKVVVTTGMIADAVKEVGGARVSVTALMGPGVDPHTYRQTHRDIVKLARADLVLWHGLHLEAQLETLLAELARRGRPVVALAEQLPREALLRDETYPARFDPHVWMDPRLWKQVVFAARDALSRRDPAGAAEYARAADAYARKLDALMERIGALYRSVPPTRRVLVTAHDAFRYFGRAHGYEVMGIQGISTESEASLNRIEALVRTLVERRIVAVFPESSAADQNLRALREGAARRGHRLKLGGELFSDAMGAPGTHEGTYIGMIEHNALSIVRALGGGIQ